MNSKQAQAKRLKMAERARQQKDLHFPQVHADWLWHRTTNDGFTTLPRTLPIVMEIIDALSKGHPAGHVLLTLWCRSPDHALLTIENPAIMASESGFSGLRAVDSWRRRMRVLVDLGFIQAKAGPAGDFHYVLLLNPNWSVEVRDKMWGDVPKASYAKFLDRIMDIGAFGEITAVRANIERWQREAAAAAAPPPPPPPLQGESMTHAPLPSIALPPLPTPTSPTGSGTTQEGSEEVATPPKPTDIT